MQVSRVDLDARKIDLRLVTEPGIKTVLKNEARRAETEQQAREKQDQAKRAPKQAEAAKVVKSKRSKLACAADEKSRAPRAYPKSGKKKR